MHFPLSQSFHKHLWNVYCVPRPALGSVNKTDVFSDFIVKMICQMTTVLGPNLRLIVPFFLLGTSSPFMKKIPPFLPKVCTVALTEFMLRRPSFLSGHLVGWLITSVTFPLTPPSLKPQKLITCGISRVVVLFFFSLHCPRERDKPH